MSALSWAEKSAPERRQSNALCSLTEATTSVRPETLFGQKRTVREFAVITGAHPSLLLRRVGPPARTTAQHPVAPSGPARLSHSLDPSRVQRLLPKAHYAPFLLRILGTIHRAIDVAGVYHAGMLLITQTLSGPT